MYDRQNYVYIFEAAKTSLLIGWRRESLNIVIPKNTVEQADTLGYIPLFLKAKEEEVQYNKFKMHLLRESCICNRQSVPSIHLSYARDSCGCQQRLEVRFRDQVWYIPTQQKQIAYAVGSGQEESVSRASCSSARHP